MTRAILLIDHGSRRAEAHEQLVELGQRLELRANSPYLIVEVAHMEIAEPSIHAGFWACIHRGATEVVAIPCLLSRGRHVSEDIPRLLSEAAVGSSIPFSLAAPLVEHDGFIELLLTAALSVNVR